MWSFCLPLNQIYTSRDPESRWHRCHSVTVYRSEYVMDTSPVTSRSKGHRLLMLSTRSIYTDQEVRNPCELRPNYSKEKQCVGASGPLTEHNRASSLQL